MHGAQTLIPSRKRIRKQFESIALCSFFAGSVFSQEQDVFKEARASFDCLIADPFWNLKSQLESAIKNAVSEEIPGTLSLLFKCAPQDKFRSSSLYECLRLAILACKDKEVGKCLLTKQSVFPSPLTLQEKQSLIELAIVRNPEFVVLFSEYEFPVGSALLKEVKQ